MQSYTPEEILLIASQKILTVSIQENHDPLIDLVNQSDILYGASPEIPNNTDYTKMRKTVYEKLVHAQPLLPPGIRFCVYEGYRSLALQKILFDNRFAQVKSHYPNWKEDEVFLETIKMISPVINQDGSQNIPPHSTGGAVDLYLIDQYGKPIDMGIHPQDWMQDLDGRLSKTESDAISTQAQLHRKIMSAVLLEQGFVNYPTEYWHWSYGDRYWAYFQENPCAIYGAC